MPKVWMQHKQTGAWEQVSEAEVGARYLSGEYGIDPEQRVSVLGRSGQTYAVKPDELENALRSGIFRVKTAQDWETERLTREHGEPGEHPLAAAGLGFARGATAGLSDRFIVGQPGVNVLTDERDITGPTEGRREGLRELKERNPKASLAGEVAGSVALTTAAGAIAEPVAPAFTGGLGRVGAGILAGVPENAIVAAGQAVSDLTLEGEDITAEKILAAAGLGGLIGGVAGGVFSAGGVLGRRALEYTKEIATRQLGRASGGFLKDFLKDFAERRAVKSIGTMLKDFRALKKTGKLNSRGRWLLDNEVVTAGSSLDDMLTKLEQIAETSGKAVGKHLDEIDQAGRTFDMVGLATRADAEILAPAAKQGGPWRSAAKRVKQWLTQRLEGGEKVPFLSAHEFKKALDDAIPYKKAGEFTPYEQSLQKLRHMLNEEFERQADEAAQAVGNAEFLNTFKAAKIDYGHAIDSAKIAKDQLLRREANRWFSPSDYGTALGGLLFGAVTGEGDIWERTVRGMGYAATVGGINRMLRTRGPQFAAALADKISSGRAIELVAKMRAVTGLSSAMDTQVGQAVTRFFGKHAEATGRRATATLVNAHYREKRKSPKPMTRVDAFRERSAELDEIMANPQALSDRLRRRTEGLADISPGLQGSTILTAQRAASFLHTKIPRNPAAARSLNPAIQKWRPSDVELARFERYVDAVENPMGILEDMQSGRISREQVEVLREVYPRLYAKIRMAFMERLTQMRQGMPYQSRLQLSILFEVPIESSMEPDFVAAMQQMHGMMGAQEGPQPKPSKPSSSTLPEQSLTPAQRLQQG